MGMTATGDGVDILVMELLCSRLCHDLAGPVGAVRNGAELLEESGVGAEGEALALVLDSAARAVARLQLFRLAYGRAGETMPRGFAEARQVVENWLAKGRVTLHWPSQTGEDTIAARPGVGRLVLNAVILAEGVLAHGGRIRVAVESGVVSVAAEGPVIRFPDPLRAALLTDPKLEDMDTRTIHAVVARRFAAHHQLRLTVAAVASDRLQLRLSW